MKRFIKKSVFTSAMLTTVMALSSVAVPAAELYPVSEERYMETELGDSQVEVNMDSSYWEMFSVNSLNEESFIEDFTQYVIDKLGEYYLQNLGRARLSADKLISSLPLNRLGEHIYPDFLGGIYINDDGNLVVQTVNSGLSRMRTENFIFTNLELSDVIIEDVEFSYNELLRIMDGLILFQEDNPHSYITQNFDVFYIDTINNRVVVELNNYSQSEIYLFRNTVIDSPAVVFVESEGPMGFFIEQYTINYTVYPIDYLPNIVSVEDDVENDVIEHIDVSSMNQVTIRPGMGLMNFSIGYRATVNGVPGFVTAGHAVALNQNIGGIGTVIGRVFGGNTDAAFVRTNTNVILSDTIFITNGPLRHGATVWVGDSIAKVGAASGVTMGRVTSTTYRALGLQGLAMTTAFAREGDSGGVVFSTPAIGPVHGGNALGIVTGGPMGGGNFFFTTSNAIANSLRAVR